MTGGSPDPPAGSPPQGETPALTEKFRNQAGGASPSPAAGQEKHKPRHPFHEKRAWRGLITIKCMVMYYF
nr:MAG TPA: hypothetical protein [Microviridae sp.]